MRRFLLLAPVALAAACLGDGEGPVTATSTPPTVPSYDVVGTLFDSLAALTSSMGSVANAQLSINGRAVVTDAAGAFVAPGIDSGAVAIVVELVDYEPLHRSLLNDGNRPLAIGLRRYAPMITGFVIAGDSVSTTVVDLQGRKSLDRWSQSNATVGGGGPPLTFYGDQMRWLAVDDYTYRVVFDAPGIQQVDWDLHDVNGFRFTAACQAPNLCDHLPSREPSDGTTN